MSEFNACGALMLFSAFSLVISQEEAGKVKVNCSNLEQVNTFETDTPHSVELVNMTTLLTYVAPRLNVTLFTQAANCSLAFFYGKSCPFSAAAAPYINALPRAYPSMPVYGVEVYENPTSSSRFGISAIPVLLLLHNGRGAAKYNASEYSLRQLFEFVQHWTNVSAVNNSFLNVTVEDFVGPIPHQVTEEQDMFLILSWVTLFLVSLLVVVRSGYFMSLVESLCSTWREAQAQHEHVD